jgi:hypothetical protein
VDAADRASRWSLGVLALANIGALRLILDVVATALVGSVVAGLLAVFILVMWVVLPARERRLDG